MTNNKGSKSPSSPLPYHSIDLQPETPPTKRRKCRDTSEKSTGNSNSSKKESNENKTIDNSANTAAAITDPVEIIPLMPNLKLEMPEYLEQDGSSCSYEEQSIGDGSTNKLGDDTLSNAEDEQKPDISQTFYSSQAASDVSDPKHTTADLGN